MRLGRIAWAVCAVVLAAALLLAQGPGVAGAKYQPTEVQRLRLKVKQLEAQVAQQNAFFAQQAFQQSVAALGQEAERVRMENGWPEELTFDQEALVFREPPVAPPNPHALPEPQVPTPAPQVK